MAFGYERPDGPPLPVACRCRMTISRAASIRPRTRLRRRETLSRTDDNILWHGHPAFRHSHQTAAASKRQAPNGSGTRNMPHVASATGELILRKLVMNSGAPASGQGGNLNKVLTTRAGDDCRMVNAPPLCKGVSFARDAPASPGWPGAWPTGVSR